jgi:hypothetical protein
MCAPRVTRHTSIRYSSFSHTRVNMVTTYTRIAYDEKLLTGRKKNLSCSFYLYGFRKYVSYGFPIINLCNPGVQYETPCIMKLSVARTVGMQTTLNVTAQRNFRGCLISVTIVAGSAETEDH